MYLHRESELRLITRMKIEAYMRICMACIRIRDRLPNGPERLASFGAPNDGPVRGMHFGGLVRHGTESEYLGPDIDDCSFRIRF